MRPGPPTLPQSWHISHDVIIAHLFIKANIEMENLSNFDKLNKKLIRQVVRLTRIWARRRGGNTA